MNIPLAIEYTQTFLPKIPSFSSFNGHAHLWVGIPFQKIMTHVVTMVFHALEEHSPAESLLFKKGNHPDIIFLEDNGDAIKVEEAKKITELVAHSAQSGVHYILIENIERMTEEAANRLLKTLEEPDSTTFFLCTTEHPHLVLPTLTSRMSTHHIAAHTYAKSSVEHIIRHWQLPWQAENISSITPIGEGSLYTIVEEFATQSTHTYDTLFSFQRIFHDILDPHTDFHTASSLLSFIYNKKEKNSRDSSLFFFCFESYLSKTVVQYIEEQDTVSLRRIRHIQQGLSQYKSDLQGNVHKKLATHHFICSFVLQNA